MPQAISLPDGMWALERKLDLSQVCQGRPTLTIKATPPSTIISLPMGCMAFGKSITLPPFYQVEEKFKSSDSFLTFLNVSSGRWTDLWNPLVTPPLNVNLRRLPKLLENIEKIVLHDLVDQVETVDGEILPTGSWIAPWSCHHLEDVSWWGGLESKKRTLVKATELQGTAMHTNT